MGPLPLVMLGGEIKTPPIPEATRSEIGYRLWLLQSGNTPGMPHSRPMPSLGPRVHELRIKDADNNWRVIYRIDPDRVLVVEVFAKKTPKTPQHVTKACRSRLRRYDAGEW